MDILCFYIDSKMMNEATSYLEHMPSMAHNEEAVEHAMESKECFTSIYCAHCTQLLLSRSSRPRESL